MKSPKQSTTKLDGTNFWAPHEGLKVAVDILKLAESYLTDGPLVPVGCSKNGAIESLRKVQAELRILRIKVKTFVEDYLKQRQPTVNSTFRPIEAMAVEYALEFLPNLRRVTAGTGAAIKLSGCGIDYPGFAIEFDPERYLDFANYSLDEVLYLIRNGKLIGMKPGQFAPPIYGQIGAHIAVRVD